MIKRLLLVLALVALATVSLSRPVVASENCSGVKISVEVGCAPSGVDANPIIDYAKAVIRFLVTLVGLGAVIALVYGGIQYMISQGDPSKVKKAKTIIGGAIGGVILLSLLVGVVNFLIPGGVL